MVDRVIKFSADAVNVPTIAAAMQADNAPNPDVISTEKHGNFVRLHDSSSDDFPNLRIALRAATVSYDFHQRRAADGDHPGWWKSRNGAGEEFENNGLSDTPITPLYSECIRASHLCPCAMLSETA